MFFNSNYMYFCHFKFYLQKHSWFISKISKIPSEFFFKTPAVWLTLKQRESSFPEQYLYACLRSRATNSTGFPRPWQCMLVCSLLPVLLLKQD